MRLKIDEMLTLDKNVGVKFTVWVWVCRIAAKLVCLFKDSKTRVMDMQFQIVDDLPVPVLLGLGFLQHVVLDMPARTVTLRLEDKEVVST